MATILASNNANSTLAGAITSIATSLNVQAGAGVLFPSPASNQYFVATLNDAATGLLTEIIHVTAVSSDTFTIVRAQEGTSALSWLSGDLIANLWTAGQFAAIGQQSQAANYGVDTGTANAYVVALTPALTAHVPGMPIRVKIGNSNTGPSTINPGPGNLAVVNPDGTLISDGQLIAGEIYEFNYNSTYYELMTQTAARVKCTGNIVFYVATTGSDGNLGTSANPFLTLQYAYNLIQSRFDLNGFAATINVADGTYTAGIAAALPTVGGNVSVTGNVGTPANVIISVASNGTAFSVQLGCSLILSGMQAQATSGGTCLSAGAGGNITFSDLIFGAATNHILAQTLGNILATGNYTIAGNATFHADIAQNAVANLRVITITLTGTPSFSGAFANVSLGAQLLVDGDTFTGSATGVRYTASLNGVIYTAGAGATYLPGNSGGSTATGGQYD